MKINKQEIKMFLAKPDKTRIAKLQFLENVNLVYKTDAVNELTFTVPYYITVDGETEKNLHYDLIKEKYLVYTEFRGKIEWFTIDDKDKGSGDSDNMLVTCYSLGYQLNYKLLIGYEATGYNCKMITDDILRGEDWKTGYINPELNLKYRKYDFSSTTKLSAIYEVGKTIDAIPIFDTIEKTVNYYKKEEISKYKGLNIGYGKYIQNIQEKTSASEIVTRLYVYGSDGLTINSVNPTGQSYIDDFSYFLYPFELDENGKIVKSSDYMSDDLAKTLVKYNKLVSERKTDFSKLLTEKSDTQKELTKEENKLHELEIELKIILDDISINKDIGESNAQNNKDRNKKNSEINKKKAEITKLENRIKEIDNEIEQLKKELKEDNFFTKDQLEELSNFIHEDEWTDDNHFDANDLYEAGFEQLKKVNEPPVNITTSLVNFIAMLSEKHNWDRFDVWDIIKIQHDRLGMDLKVHISEITFPFDGEENISVTIKNENKKVSLEDKFENTLYTVHKVDTDYNKRKINWERIAYNFNIRNDRIDKKPVPPESALLSHKENDDGSVNLELEWKYPEFSKTKKDEHNIDGFLIYLYPSDSDEPYQFGSIMSKETIVDVSHYSKSYVFPSLPSNLYYTVGTQAYRRVDDDINVEGIIQSDIVTFSDKRKSNLRTLRAFSNTTQSEDDFVELTEPYQPSKVVNFRGNVNGVYLTSKNQADLGKIENGHLIYDEESRQWLIWDSETNTWKNTLDSEKLKEELEANKKYIEQTMEELNKDLEEMNQELEKELDLLDKEMKHLEEEVIPSVEKAVEETTIPEYTSDPSEIPTSGLYLDISVSPPRLKIWDEESNEWNNVAPNEQDINSLIEKMRQDAVAESVTYSKADIVKVRKNIEKKIQNEIEKIQDDIGELLEIKDELIRTVETIDELLDDYDGRFTDFEQRVDEVEGVVSTTITDIERIDGVVQGHASSIEQNAESIKQKVSSIDYERDKTGILSNIESNETAINQLSSEIELRVTKEEFENATNDFDERISSAETNITLNSEAIELKAEKSELTNYVDKQVYNNKIGELDVAIDNITGRVESTEVDFNDFKTGDYNTFKQQYGEFKLEMDNFTTKVGELSDIDGTLVDSFSEVRQEVGLIESTVQDVIVDVNGLEDSMTAVQTTISQLPDEIDLSVKKGIGLLELGGTNLVLDSEEVKTIDNTFGAWYLSERFFSEYDTSDDFIISFDAKADTKDEILRVYTNSGDIRTQETVPLTTNWKRYEVVADFSGLEFERIAFGTNGFSGGTNFVGHVRKVKIEKGTKSTDWSPAPEDGVAKTNVLSSINLSTEGVKIEGAKIDIKGVAEFMSNNVNLLPMHPSNWENGYISISGGKDIDRDYSIRTADFIAIEPNTEYTLNNISGASIFIREFEEDGFVNNHPTKLSEGNDRTFTTGENSRYIRFYWSNSSVDKIFPDEIGVTYKATFVKGSTPLSWEDAKTTIINGGRIVTNNITANQLNVDNIFGNSAVIAEIQSGAIKTAKLDATQIDTGILNASRIGAESITTTKLAANAVTANKINVDEVFANTAVVNKIKSDIVQTTKLLASQVDAGVISASKITGGTINAANVTVSNSRVIIDEGIKIIRPDGAVWMEDGVVKQDFAVTGYDPLQVDGVTHKGTRYADAIRYSNKFYRSDWVSRIDGTEDDYSDIRDQDKGYTISFHTYETIHSARYIVFGMRSANNSSQPSRFRVRVYNESTMLGSIDLDRYSGYSPLTIDLGTPTFERVALNLRIGFLKQWKNSKQDQIAFRINRIYLTDVL